MINTAENALNLALKDSDYAEVYIEREKSIDVDIQRNEINFAKEEITYGISVRVILEGKMGFSYTTNIDKIDEAAKNAIFNAKSNIEDEYFEFAQKSKYNQVKDLYDKKK